jgi:DNA-binding NarL/FixJ family response regulator
MRRPAFVVTDLALSEGDGIAICRAAKSLSPPAIVLVTTSISSSGYRLLSVRDAMPCFSSH